MAIGGTTLNVRTTQHSSSTGIGSVLMRMMGIFSIEVTEGSTVAGNNTVKAPLITQDMRQQAVTATAGFAFQPVVCAHHFLHMSLLH